MDKDFHYYVTYIAAATAGWEAKDAHTIAHAAQYVDDCTPSAHSGNHRFTYEGMEYGIINTCFDNSDNAILSTEACHSVWMPFHFLPGNYQSKNDGRVSKRNYLTYNGKTSYLWWRYDEEKQEFFKRMCIPKSYMSELMINNTATYSNSAFFKELIGIRMHVLADTVAHAFYSGMLHWYMNDVIGDVYDDRHGKIEYGPTKEWSTIPDARFESIFYLGHGRIGHIPDYAHCNYRYMPQWNQEKKQAVYINHTNNFKFAFRLLVQAMHCLLKKTTFQYGVQYTANDLSVLPELEKMFAKDIGFYHEQNDYDKNVARRCEGYGDLIAKLKLSALPNYDKGLWYKKHQSGEGKNFANFNFAAIKHFQMFNKELCDNNIKAFDRLKAFDDARLSMELSKIQTPPLKAVNASADQEAQQLEGALEKAASVKDLPIDQSIFRFFEFYDEEIKVSGSYGSNRLNAFDDSVQWRAQGKSFPTEIVMRMGDVIDCLSFKYGATSFPAHGGSGGGEVKLALQSGEYVTRIAGSYGTYWNRTFIVDLMFYTNKGRSIGKLRSDSRYTSFGFSIPSGSALTCVKGFTDEPTGDVKAVGKTFLSAIAVYYKIIS